MKNLLNAILLSLAGRIPHVPPLNPRREVARFGPVTGVENEQTRWSPMPEFDNQPMKPLGRDHG